MKESSKKCFLIAFFALITLPLYSQWSVGITIGGLAIHQGKPHPELYPTKLDKKGIAVVVTALNLSVSYRINDYVGIKAMQSLVFRDSAGKFAGISHLGVELHDDIVGIRSQEHQMSMSIGPFFYYRKGWDQMEGYNNDPDFITLSKSGLWEQKFVWYGGFFRYNYALDERNDLAIDLLPGFPHVYAFSMGINRKD